MNVSEGLSPQMWITHLFSAKAACQGGVVRRQIRDIEHFVGLTRFLEELDRRGFQAVENAGQLVIFCNREPVRIVRPRSFQKDRPEIFKDFGPRKSIGLRD